MTKWLILFSITVCGMDRNNLYNIINTILGPRLIVISQAIGEKRIPKFISSGWEQFKSFGMAQTVYHTRSSFNYLRSVQQWRSKWTHQTNPTVGASVVWWTLWFVTFWLLGRHSGKWRGAVCGDVTCVWAEFRRPIMGQSYYNYARD